MSKSMCPPCIPQYRYMQTSAPNTLLRTIKHIVWRNDELSGVTPILHVIPGVSGPMRRDRGGRAGIERDWWDLDSS